MITEVSRRYTLDVEAYPFRVPQVRRIVAAHLRHWQLEPLMQPVGLGVCELLTNVHLHTGPDKACTVELRWSGHRLTVSVTDNDPHLPQVCNPGPMATRGRGLAMVAALGDSWGTHAIPGGGKAVWFTLRTDSVTKAGLRPVAPRPEVPTAVRLLEPVPGQVLASVLESVG